MQANRLNVSGNNPQHTCPHPFPTIQSVDTSAEDSHILITDVDLNDMLQPLLTRLPVIDINPEASTAAKTVGLKLPVTKHDGRSLNARGRKDARSKNARRQQARRDRQLDQKMESGRKHAATFVASPASFSSFPTTGAGWAGRDVRYKTDQAWLQKAWLERTIVDKMYTQGFKMVAFEGKPTWLVDKNGIIFGYRTDIPSWMTKLTFNKGTVSLLTKIAEQCQKYIKDCGDISQQAVNANRRGPHWFHVSGVDRQISFAPKLTAFHVKHRAITDALMARGSPLQRLVGLAEDIFRRLFPWLAARVDNCNHNLLELGVPPELANPQYGCWYNFCINGARGTVKGVSTRPHADAKNLALMMCAVFVYGKFNSKEKAWLVLWEAGLILELPVGVFIFYPSALFTHFNVDMTDLTIVTTGDGSKPTRDKSSPLNGVDGRGSIVLFNQASLFQLAELGRTVAQAKREGMSTVCDNEEWIEHMPVVDMY